MEVVCREIERDTGVETGRKAISILNTEGIVPSGHKCNKTDSNVKKSAKSRTVRGRI